MNAAKPEQRLRAVIVGAGFAGLCLAVRLKQLGIDDFVVLERARGLGGVWRDNFYPGAACDIPAVLYSYSFDAEYPWSAGYPAQAEILQYMQRVVDKYDLARHLHFDAEVRRAAYDERAAGWEVQTAGGQTWRAQIFVPAVGIFNDPVVPRLPGLQDFPGPVFHSAQWRHDVPLDGRNVAVIGTGASAIQIVPEVAPAAARLTVFQRTPPYVLPKSVIAPHQPVTERARIFAEFETFAARRKDRTGTEAAQQRFMEYLAQQVPDPELRAKLTPDYLLGCKRGLFSNDWYPALQRPNVFVENDVIEAIRPSSIATRSGRQHPADVIVLATGFNPSNYFPRLEVQGRHGALLQEAWHDGAEAYLGICVTGFPNMFIMYGPNTNVPGSVLFMLECQAEFICNALVAMQERGARAMEVIEEAMRRDCDQVQAELRESSQSAAHCQSYYMNAAGRVVTNYPGTQTRYRDSTARVAQADFTFLR